MMKHSAPLIAAAFLAFAIPAASAAEDGTPENMQQRSMQMDKMMKQAEQAKTPAERQNLMAEHMEGMHLQMAAMHDMMKPGGTMARHHDGAAMSPEDAAQMQMKMQGMMQGMMAMMMQMMQHQPALKLVP